MRKVNYLFVLWISISLWTCTDNSNVTIPGQTQFFDLKSYFEQEYKRLDKVEKVIKKADIAGQVEEKTVSGIDFKTELALFVDSDINKVSWLDKYEVDSIHQNNQLSQLVYKAKDGQLKTNKLSIFFAEEKVRRIEIIRKTGSIAATLKQELIYEPATGYSVKSIQHTSLSEPYVLALDVRFVQ